MHPKDDSTEPICLYCIAHFGMHVHSSLVNVVLHDSRPERSQSWPRILLSRRSHQSLNFSWMLHLGISNFHFSPESDACLCWLCSLGFFIGVWGAGGDVTAGKLRKQ